MHTTKNANIQMRQNLHGSNCNKMIAERDVLDNVNEICIKKAWIEDYYYFKWLEVHGCLAFFTDRHSRKIHLPSIPNAHRRKESFAELIYHRRLIYGHCCIKQQVYQRRSGLNTSMNQSSGCFIALIMPYFFCLAAAVSICSSETWNIHDLFWRRRFICLAEYLDTLRAIGSIFPRWVWSGGINENCVFLRTLFTTKSV